MPWRLEQGDCLEVLKGLPTASLDSLVTDPPAGIDFMHRDWDCFRRRHNPNDVGRDNVMGRMSAHAPHSYGESDRGNFITFMTAIMVEAFRVLKPGAHGLVWALPRTSHWTATALEDAGFEVRDCLTHVFGSGFPKSQDTRKAGIKSGIACDCQTDGLQYPHGTATENLRDVRPTVVTGDPVSGETESHLFSEVCREDDSARRTDTDESAPSMPNLWGVSAIPLAGDTVDEVLLGGLRGEGEGSRSEDAGSSTEHLQQLKGKEPTGQGDVRGEESCMEGRRDLQAGQGQLPRPEVCSLSGAVPRHGSDGRICDGTPARDGTVDRPVPEPDGSSSPQRPQSAQQLAGQPRTLAEQSGAQAGRSWPMCSRCGKPILPEGLGSALKPATEHWILVRKPLSESSIARNVLRHGVGALNIDASRVERAADDVPGWHTSGANGSAGYRAERCPDCIWGVACETCLGTGFLKGTFVIREMSAQEIQERCGDKGRWPTNLVLSHDESCAEGQCSLWCPIAILDEQTGTLKSGKMRAGTARANREGWAGEMPARTGEETYGDSGGASRFFPRFYPEEVPCRLCAVNSVIESSGTMQAIGGGSAPWTAADNPVERFARLVRSAETLCERCVTTTALLLAGRNPVQEPELQVGLDSMPEHRRLTLLRSLALLAEVKALTGTTPTIADLRLLFGYVRGVITDSIPAEEGALVTDLPRFKYQAKPSRSEREEGLEALNFRTLNRVNPGGLENEPRFAPIEVKNNHPTVKGKKLMAWLIKLITPPGGCVLDPFAGSGSTGVAALENDFSFLGIEQDAGYYEIAEARLQAAANAQEFRQMSFEEMD